jgi:hypothetical protein
LRRLVFADDLVASVLFQHEFHHTREGRFVIHDHDPLFHVGSFFGPVASLTMVSMTRVGITIAPLSSSLGAWLASFSKSLYTARAVWLTHACRI